MIVYIYMFIFSCSVDSTSSFQDLRGQRSSQRFQTWPVVYYEPNMPSSDGSRVISPPSESHSDSEKLSQTSERTDRSKRTPIKLNPAKPIVEFVRKTEKSDAESSASDSENQRKSQEMAQTSEKSKEIVSKIPKLADMGTKKTISLNLKIYNDENVLKSLIPASVLSVLSKSAPKYAEKYAENIVSVAIDVNSKPVIFMSDESVIEGMINFANFELFKC